MAELAEWQELDINRQMTRLYPSLPHSELRPFIALVLERLREATVDIYEVSLSNTRDFGGDTSGYFSYKEVERNGSIVFIRLRVD